MVLRSSFFIWLSKCLLAASITACASQEGEPNEFESFGTLSVPLHVSTPSGYTYQLRNAIFTISNSSGFVTSLNSSGATVSAPRLMTTVPSGTYTVQLEPGWELVRLDDAGLAPLAATLTSPSSTTVVVDGVGPTLALASFTFEVPRIGPVNAGGALGIQIAVSEISTGVSSLNVQLVAPASSNPLLGARVTSNPPGIACSAGPVPCSTSYYNGTGVTLKAESSGAIAFSGWSGASCAVTTTPQITLLMDQARNCTATFVPAGSFTPAALGPLAWYAAQSQYVTAATNGLVSSWADRSGNGFAVQSTGVNQPTWSTVGWSTSGGGTGALLFNGSQHLSSTALGIAQAFNGEDTSFSVLAVLRPASDSDGGVATWDSGATTALRARISDGGPSLRFQAMDGATTPANDDPASLSTSTGNVVAWVRNGTTSVLYTDGNAPDAGTVDVGPISANTFRIGAALTGPDILLHGALAELVIVPRAINVTEFQQFRTYARARWSGLP